MTKFVIEKRRAICILTEASWEWSSEDVERLSGELVKLGTVTCGIPKLG